MIALAVRRGAAAFALAFAMAGCTLGAPLQGKEAAPPFDPGRLTDRPVGEANRVMVLGTAHLSGLPDPFRPDMVDPLVGRLVTWKPSAVATEDIAGTTCDAMRRQGRRFADEVEAYCFDPSAANAATGLSVAAATAEAERLLGEWPAEPTAANRRNLAAILLAAGEPGSALVQWLRLSPDERKADGILAPALAALLDRRLARTDETSLVAARVAARSGLERLWSVDDQAVYLGPLADEAAYGAAISRAWDNPATAARTARNKELQAGLAEPGGLLAMYRDLNDPSSAMLAYRSDWGAALADPSPQGYGRRYVAYWETRNLRMVANIREVLGRRPGSRLLAIVGASHKPYYEAYLRQMRDVELVDVAPMLAP